MMCVRVVLELLAYVSIPDTALIDYSGGPSVRR